MGTKSGKGTAKITFHDLHMIDVILQTNVVSPGRFDRRQRGGRPVQQKTGHIHPTIDGFDHQGSPVCGQQVRRKTQIINQGIEGDLQRKRVRTQPRQTMICRQSNPRAYSSA